MPKLINCIIPHIHDPKLRGCCSICSTYTEHWTDFEDRKVTEQVPICAECSCHFEARDVPTVPFLRAQKFRRHWIVRSIRFVWRQFVRALKASEHRAQERKEFQMRLALQMQHGHAYKEPELRVGRSRKHRAERSPPISQAWMGLSATKKAFKGFKL